MATSIDDVDVTVLTSATSSGAMEDGRGFTTAGTEYRAPDFESISPYKRTAKKKPSRRQGRPLHKIPAPLTAVSPEDLGLDDTLVEGESFMSSGSSSHGGHYHDQQSITTGNSTSYSRAVLRGGLDSQMVMRNRKPSMLKSVMSRFRTTSVSSTSSTMEEIETRHLTSAKALKKELSRIGLYGDLDSGTTLFAIMRRSYPTERKRAKLLAALLTYSDANVNERDPSGMTAIHFAMEECDLESAKILVAFGANINATNQEGKTPLDTLRSDIDDVETTVTSESSEPSPSPEHGKQHKATPKTTPKSKQSARLRCMEFLKSIGGLSNEFATRTSPDVQPFPQVPSSSPALTHRKSYAEVLDWEAQITSHYSDLERNIRSKLQNTTRAGQEAVMSTDTAISLAVQLQEMMQFQKAGSRVLCLDGGGIRGLIQLEILSQLEAKTGRKVTELFDWIVGTSTGGVIALGLVYAKKSLAQLRQLYFRMREEVFGKVKGAMSFNTAGLERILKREFTETRCMDDETYPRVLISAVKKDHINLKLHFFNNCFNDDYHKHWPVWKVARYTCAAPVLFGESDEYVDGGLLANNPSDSALSRIQAFHRSHNEKFPLSLVVSVGCGKFPFQRLGNVDFLFVGSQWSSLAGTSNLMALLSYALVEPSVADENCRSRCEEQGVRYFRLNPRLEEVVASGETNLKTLTAAILQTRKEMESRIEFSNLVLCLHELSDASRKMHTQLNGVQDSSDGSGSSII